MLWIISGPSSVGKSTFIRSKQCFALTGLRSKTFVVKPMEDLPGQLNPRLLADVDCFVHYNMLRPVSLFAKHEATNATSQREYQTRSVQFSADRWWNEFSHQVKDKPKRVVVVVANLAAILERAGGRRGYNIQYWRSLYEKLNLPDIYRAWCSELERQQIPFVFVDATGSTYPCLDAEAAFKIVDRNVMNTTYSKQQIEKILQEERFGYHRINLPYGLQTSGRDRSRTRDLIFRESLTGKSADTWVIFATVELPLCYGLLWILTRAHYRELTCIYASLVIFRFTRRVFVRGGFAESDPPFSDPLRKHPRLAALTQVVRADFGLRGCHTVVFLLSPVAWPPFGCSAHQLRRNKRLTVISIGCLEIYSIFDLRCERAQALIRAQSRFLVPACERNRRDLERLARPPAFRSRPQWQIWAVSRIRNTYERNLRRWNVFADLQADHKIASKYGAFAVSTWIQALATRQFFSYGMHRSRIAALAEDGILLPVSGTCRAFHMLLESEWLDSLRTQMVEQEREPRCLAPILLRLGALQHGLENAGGTDPRSAATLFDELSALEESVVRNEIQTASGVKFKRPEANQFAKDGLIPLMHSELSRNANLVANWKLSDLPDLVVKKNEIARAYRADPRFLFGSHEREALIPGLFTSFFTVELVEIGWVPSHSEEMGSTLTHGPKSIQPDAIVDALLKGELSREAFLVLIA